MAHVDVPRLLCNKMVAADCWGVLAGDRRTLEEAKTLALSQ